MTKYLSIALLALSLTFLSCSGGKDTPPTPEPVKVIAVESLTLNESSLDLYIGDSESLTVEVLPENASDKTVTWSSSAPNVASVDYNGKVTAIALGNSVITTKSQSGNKEVSCLVTVTEYVPVTSIRVLNSPITLYVGDTAKIQAEVLPDNATDNRLRFELMRNITDPTFNENSSTVSEDGTVTAKEVGKQYVYIFSYNRAGTPSPYATCLVEVLPVEYKPEPIPDGTVRHLVKSDRSRAFNIVFICDGFQSSEGYIYNKMVDQIVEHIFSFEPFKSYKGYFNVSSVFAESQDSGIREPQEPPKNTAFNSSITLPLIPDKSRVSKFYYYLDLACSNTIHKIVFVQHRLNRVYAGGAGSMDNSMMERYDQDDLCRVSASASSYYVREVAAHEFSHLFNLCDEYDFTVNSPDGTISDYELYLALETYNVDNTNNPQRSKWSHFIGRKGYENVGFFTVSDKIPNFYKPTVNSLMSDGMYYKDWQFLNAPSREGIVREVFKVVGENFTLEKFFEKDVPNGY